MPAPTAGVLAEILVEAGNDVAVGAVIGRIEDGAGGRRAARRRAERGAPRSRRWPRAAGRRRRPATPARAMRAGRGRARGARRRPVPRRPARPRASSPTEKGVDLAAVPATGPKGNVTKGDVLRSSPPRAGRAGAALRGAGSPASAPSPPAPRPRGAGPDDPAPEAHRRAAEGGAEHRRHADDLQRGRHDGDDRAARPLPGRVHQEARRQARLHGLLREGRRSRRSRPTPRSTPRSTATRWSTSTTTTSASRSAPTRAWWCRWCATPTPWASPTIEKKIADLGKRARDGKLAMEDLTGGTFTITNGGVFGSMLSTPILNPPQVGILGMHATKQRRGGDARRLDPGPADDVPGALLRPPHHRRPRGGELPGPGQGVHRGPERMLLDA